MVRKVTISLSPEELQALDVMAEKDFRPPKDQIRWLLHEEAYRRGLWERGLEIKSLSPDLEQMNAAELVLLLESIRDFQEFYWSTMTAVLGKLEADAKARRTELWAGG